jgi:predicted  nucleic acid-binding Zn-ribbon protein
LEAEIRNDPDYSKRLDEFNETLEKFKLKLEILRMKFENKSFKMKEGFDKEMLNARIEIDQFLEKAGEKWEKAGKKYANFSTEMNQVYDHLKKAVRSL